MNVADGSSHVVVMNVSLKSSSWCQVSGFELTVGAAAWIETSPNLSHIDDWVLDDGAAIANAWVLSSLMMLKEIDIAFEGHMECTVEQQLQRAPMHCFLELS